MFEELEYKYRADNISLTQFKALMGDAGVIKQVVVSSWDIYYVSEKDENSFQRLRMGTSPELTKKVKTVNANNWQRVEVDLPLDPDRITEETVTKYVGLDGYKENFRIFKSCDIHFLEHLNFVYYVVYNHNWVEIGRFIEVEVNKSSVQTLEAQSAGQAMAKLRQGEKYLEPLGINAQNRLKKSLFELFKKEVQK